MEELVGLGALLSALIEVAKKLGFIPDGQGGLWVAIANVIVFAVAEVVVGYFGVNLGTIDGILLMLSQILLSIFASFAVHKVARAMELPLFRKA